MRQVRACLSGWVRAQFSNLAGVSPRQTAKISGISVIPACVESLEPKVMLTVTYQGGALLKNVEAQGVYLGSDWKTNTNLQTQTTKLDQYLSSLVQSSYMDMLTNAGYNVGRGSAVAGAVNNVTLDKTNGVTDAQIRSYLQAMITAGTLAAPSANRLYIVYVAPGTVIKNGTDASNKTFLGYHGAYAGKNAANQSIDIRYAVIAYPGSPNFTSSSQGFATDFDQLTAVSSHELAEAVTDPDVNYKTMGWYDFQKNGEIGDLTRTTSVLNGYVVQNMVDKNDAVITPAGTTTTTLTAPQNVTVSAQSSTSALLSWGAVTGTQGYRIFRIDGTTKTLLGTVSSTSTSVQLTGMTAGGKYTFMVEAYNSAQVADSSTVTITLPTSSVTLTAPTVTATIVSSTSISLNWNLVSNAQGYRIYQWDGTKAVLLGSVSGSTKSVTITNMLKGTTYKFFVEAYNGTVVADSAWVTVTTPKTGATPIHASSSVQIAGVEHHGAKNFWPSNYTPRWNISAKLR